MKYKIVLQKSEEGYSVGCIGLPGCWSQGETEEEAIANIKDAIKEYLEVAEEVLREGEIQEVEIHREDFKTVVIPLVKLDPTLGLSPSNPSVTNASEKHNAYFSGRLLSDYAEILKDSPNFNGDPVEIQKRMRDEWS